MSRVSRSLVVLLVGAGCFGVVGCGQTEIPNTDPSAPEVFMFVGGLGNLIQLESGGSSVTKTMKHPVDLGIVGFARDSQSGIKRVTVEGAAIVYCSDNAGIGMLKKAVYINSDQDPSSLPVGALVPISRLTWVTVGTNTYYVDPTDPSKSPYCPPGFEFKEFYGGFYATGVNYKGQLAASPKFSFSYKPGSSDGDDSDDDGADMMPGTEGIDFSLRLALEGDFAGSEEVFFESIDDLPRDLPGHPEYLELREMLQSPEGASWFFSAMLDGIEEASHLEPRFLEDEEIR